MDATSNLKRARSLVMLLGLAAWTVGVGDLTADSERDGSDSHSARTGPAAGPVLHTRTSSEVALRGQSVDSGAVYLDDRVMVKLANGVSLDGVARALDSEPLREAGAAGWAALGVPTGLDTDGFLAQLATDDRVLDSAPIGVIRGVVDESKPLRPSDLQWHLAATHADEMPATDLSLITVAVLDSGVAYEDYADGTDRYSLAPSLAGSTIVAPWDFVNDDSHPNDDNGHGTHIASLIASVGAVTGIAPGAGLMPLKVLDAANGGNELDLIDALHHAANNGADVVNLSLSFTLGYSPSSATLAALQAVDDAGAVMVGAAGNDGVASVTWPAAHPLVVAVGAWRLDDAGATVLADYSNHGPGVDLLAPGGSLDHDSDADGYPDGTVGEAIDPADPESVGYWIYAGTSQAAAMVSGAAAHLVEAGASGHQVRHALQAGASAPSGGQDFAGGLGAGTLHVRNADNAWLAGTAAVMDDRRWSASMFNYLAGSGTNDASLVSEISLIDGSQAPVAGATVHVTVQGSDDEQLSCVTDAGGFCAVSTTDFKVVRPDLLLEGSGASAIKQASHDALRTDPIWNVIQAGKPYTYQLSQASVEAMAAAGQLTPQPVASQAWVVSVAAAVRDGIATHPGTHLYVSDAFEVLLAAIADDPSLAGVLLGYHFDTGFDKDLDTRLIEAYVAVNTGTGLVGSPLGVVFTPWALGDAKPEYTSLDLDGTGLVGSPLGFLDLPFLDLFGSGLVGSPLGFTDFPFLFLNGSGLVGSPLGITGFSIFTMEGSGLVGSPLGFWDPKPLPLFGAATSVSGTAVGTWYDGGGFISADGYQAASGLAASELVGLESAAFDLDGVGTQGIQVR